MLCKPTRWTQKLAPVTLVDISAMHAYFLNKILHNYTIKYRVWYNQQVMLKRILQNDTIMLF